MKEYVIYKRETKRFGKSELIKDVVYCDSISIKDGRLIVWRDNVAVRVYAPYEWDGFILTNGPDLYTPA